MRFSDVFIRRPVATSLITLAIALAGLAAYSFLPVASLPRVDFPTIFVQASLPGADPSTMATSVAMPLERALGRIAGITEMTSSSTMGRTRIIIQFDLDRDIDGAARDVQSAINAANGLLPSGLPSKPIYRKANPSAAPVLIMSLTSETMTPGQIYDAASLVMTQKISQVYGVGEVVVGGASMPAIRVQVNPQAVNSYGLALTDIQAAIARANANRPKGYISDGGRQWQLDANDQIMTPAELAPLVISYSEGRAVRLSDVAKVEESVQDVRNAGLTNGLPSIVVLVFRQPDANTIETVQRVQAVMPAIMASLPPDINVRTIMNRAPGIEASLRELKTTLFISIILVIVVVFVFLRSAPAVLIPSVAVPVSLIGAFGVLYLGGFSLDNISLMALTVATGFVVDDAIVMLENISRHVENGQSPYRAAVKGAREVGATIMSISFSLIAVFIPILLMGGIVGRLFHEFAVTISTAILVSLFISLTTTPMMCAYLLRKKKPRARTASTGDNLDHLGKSLFSRLQKGYAYGLGMVLRHQRLTLLSLGLVIVSTIALYVFIPKGFFPQQDTGRLVGSIQADQSVSFQAMQAKLAKFIDIIKRDEAVLAASGFTGGGNSGSVMVTLKPRDQRTVTADQVIARLRDQLASEPGATLLLQSAQELRVGGRQSMAQYQYTLQASDLTELRDWSEKMLVELRNLDIIKDLNTDQQDEGLQVTLEIDRDSASRLGVSMAAIDRTLNDSFGQSQISTIYTDYNQYKIVLEIDQAYGQNPQDLKEVYVPGRDGLVPLAGIATYRSTPAPLAVNHQEQFVAYTISFNLAEDVSLSQVTEAIEGIKDRIGMPDSIQSGFQGTAKFFQKSMASQPWLILAALITLYIVLGILYESLIHPITILSTLPSAGVGALVALVLCGLEFSLIALIGILLLAGIVKKNAILMIDFALTAERNEGLTPEQAIFKACLLRFRPIMMTTAAAILGALPLAFGTGEGAELRRPLGISIVGGLIMSQLLTLFTTPVVYLYMDRLQLWRKKRAAVTEGRSDAEEVGKNVLKPV